MYLGIVPAELRHKKNNSQDGFGKLKRYLLEELDKIHDGRRKLPIVVVFCGSIAAGKSRSTVFIKKGALGLRGKEIAVIHYDKYLDEEESLLPFIARYKPIDLENHYRSHKLILIEGTDAFENIDKTKIDYLVYLRCHLRARILNNLIRDLNIIWSTRLAGNNYKYLDLSSRILISFFKRFGDTSCGAYYLFIRGGKTALP